MATESYVDILIVGAGPAGLMCAQGFVKAGLNVKIVDQSPTKTLTGRADGLHPRTLEVLHSYGLAERIFSQGNQMHMIAFYNPGPNGGIEQIEKLPIIQIAADARFLFSISLNQGAIEDVFLDAMAASNLTVDRLVCPSSIELSEDEAKLKDPTSYPVRVVLKHIDAHGNDNDSQSEIVHAKFVIGADGAHSWVRKSMGIQMEGEQTDYIWGVVDTTLDTDFPDVRCISMVHSTNGSCMLIPRENNMIRLYVQLIDKQVVDPKTGRIDKDKIGPLDILEVAQQSFKPYTLNSTQIDWWTVYIIGQRVATKFSVHERVFIIGDACHTHSPKGGQGMNAAMNDSHNIIWKLAHVIRGWADISVLKTYEFERQKFAQDLINLDRKLAALFSDKPRTEENKNGVTHDEFSEIWRKSDGFMSGVGIHYASSVITSLTGQPAASNLAIGHRLKPQIIIRAADAQPFEIQDLCPSNTRFKILLFVGDLKNPEQAQRVNRLAADMSAPAPEGFLTKFDRRREQDPGEWDAFDILTICVGKNGSVSYLDVPSLFRSHWSKVYVDDATQCDKAYPSYGIDPCTGAIVVVRPDGYVGAVAPLDNVSDIDMYFAAFMVSSY